MNLREGSASPAYEQCDHTSRSQRIMTTTTETEPEYLLGVDIGTSTVKTVLVNKVNLRVDGEYSKSLGAHLTVLEENGYERDVHEIFTCLDHCLSSLNSAALQNVVSIGVCGQMHGCVLWKSGESFLNTDGSLRKLFGDSSSSSLSSTLITWQDGRCTPDFLSTLPKTHQPIQLSAGYGCATLAWLKQFRPDLLEKFDRAGTIMDLVVWALCGHHLEDGKQVIMSSQNAASWGFFDINKLMWETEV